MDLLRFLSIYFAVPGLLLIVLYRSCRYPWRMTILMFFVGPFIGTGAMVILGELSKSSPQMSHVLGAIILFYFVYALPLFGLWIAAAGTILWLWARRWRLAFFRLPESKIWRGVVLGSLAGPPVIFLLWAGFSLDPDWPTERIQQILRDGLSIFFLAIMGALSGAGCGAIAGQFPKAERSDLIVG